MYVCMSMRSSSYWFVCNQALDGVKSEHKERDTGPVAGSGSSISTSWDDDKHGVNSQEDA